MSTRLSDLTEQLLKAAQNAGADVADAMAVDGRSVSIDVLGGKLEHAESADGVEVGLRVILGTKQACVSASDTRPETIQVMAERAVAMAKMAPGDPVVGLADPDQLARNWDLAALELSDTAPDPSPTELEELARQAETAALEVKGVSKVQSASASMGRTAIHLAATNGFSGGYERSSYSVSAVAITGRGTEMERDYAAEGRVYFNDLPSAQSIGTLAGERAVERAGSRKPPTGTYPVLFDERIAASLIGHLVAATNGANIVRGSSWAAQLLGKNILPDGIDLVENPLRPRVASSRPFDAEGLSTQERSIVSGGILQGWTLDLGTARKLGLKSTASASRSTSAPPTPTTTNLWLTPGAQTREGLIGDMGTGLLVTSMIGSTINPNTGDYSRGAAGFWVENGEIAYPVNECTIAGNLIEMLQRIVPANDAQPHLSRVIPSLLVDCMVLAGD